MADHSVISADSHLNEPMEVYDRLPAEYRARAPRLEVRDGKTFIIVEGQPPRPMEAPNPLTEDDMSRYWRDGEEVGRVFHRAGGIDIPLRLADQELDGVSAEVIYPHGTFNTFSSRDPGFQLALARVYNDYYNEVFGAYPDRFAVSAIVPTLDIDNAISEATRAANMGFRSLSIPISMPMQPYNDPFYDPFWAAIEEVSVPLALHIFTDGPGEKESSKTLKRAGPGEDLAFEVVDMAAAMKPLCLLVASGILERHPGLRFVLVECGIGWLAWVLQTLDEIYQKRHMWIEPKLEMKPSDYFRRQGGATFGDDPVGLNNRDVTGVDCLMWGNDYPHDEGTFPNSREVIERTFKDIPEDEKWKIVGGNAARVYRFPTN